MVSFTLLNNIPFTTSTFHYRTSGEIIVPTAIVANYLTDYYVLIPCCVCVTEAGWSHTDKACLKK